MHPSFELSIASLSSQQVRSSVVLTIHMSELSHMKSLDELLSYTEELLHARVMHLVFALHLLDDYLAVTLISINKASKSEHLLELVV